MTDKEIIGIMKNCSDCICYEDCAYKRYGIYCREHLMENAIDIINRQQAEIERLKSNVFGMEFETAMYKVISESARAEAIKEFAENLKYDWFGGFNAYGIGAIYTIIDAAVKEMVGAE